MKNNMKKHNLLGKALAAIFLSLPLIALGVVHEGSIPNGDDPCSTVEETCTATTVGPAIACTGTCKKTTGKANKCENASVAWRTCNTDCNVSSTVTGSCSGPELVTTPGGATTVACPGCRFGST